MNRKERRREHSLAAKRADDRSRSRSRNEGQFSSEDAPILQTSIKLPAQKSRSLFHYTTASGLIGIIKTQSLFATHANFLNDSAECKILREILKPRLIPEMSAIIDERIQQRKLSPVVREKFGESLPAIEVDRLLDAMVTATEHIAPLYIISFCLHSESEPEYQNGLLSQWRGYADGGFAIEFDELKLDELANLEAKKFQYQGILSEAVIYENHIERVNPQQFDGLCHAMLRELFEEDKSAISDAFKAGRFKNYTRAFLSILPFLKSQGFMEEREYRIAALCNRPQVSAPGDTRQRREVEFRESSSGSVVPYIRVFDQLPEQLPIKGILVGPHKNQENQITALKLLLDRYEIKAEVRSSTLTFRHT